MNKTLFFLSVILLIAFSSVYSQLTKPQILTVQAYSSQDKIIPGSSFDLAVVLQIDPEYHINSHTPADEFFIPTVVSFSPLQGLLFAESVYPQAKLMKFAFSQDNVSVYSGEVVIKTQVTAQPDIAVGSTTITGQVSYQGCNDAVCFAPVTETFSLQLPVVTDGSAVVALNTEYFASSENAAETTDSAQSFTADENKALAILDKGIFYALAAFFLVGLALNLTPCVYPVIPMTVSYFSTQGSKSKRGVFFSALFYLFGIAIAFALLGLVSGLAGKQWGFLFTSPWFVVLIAIVILAMAASLFGAFEITVPSWLLTGVGKSRKGTIGSLLMGLTVGVVIAPCAAGILIGLVGLIAKTGLVLKGTLLFFVMGLGLGLPYLILASFSGLLQKLPQSGIWMIWIRKFFAVLLVGVALYFIVPQLDHIYDKFAFLAGILAVFGGLLLGFLDDAPGYTKKFKLVRAGIGILFILAGLHWINSAIQSKPSDIDWIYYKDQEISSMTGEKPVFIDFYADWCAPCKQLDRETFSDDQVVEKSRAFHMLKVDCTKPDKATQKLMDAFQVSGMPTLIFLSKSGSELHELRETGFVGSTKFISAMDKTLAAE